MKRPSRVAADRAKAREWLEGATRTNERNHPRRVFLSGREEKEARKALARLVMTDDLDDGLRRTLAQCIDPTLFGGKEFIGPRNDGDPATEHPVHFDVVRRNTPDFVKKLHIIGYLAQRVTEERGSLARAIEAAHEEFGLSPKTLEKEYWVPYAPMMRQLMPVLRTSKEEQEEEERELEPSRVRESYAALVVGLQGAVAYAEPDTREK